jgi:hypothetical protein
MVVGLMLGDIWLGMVALGMVMILAIREE